MIISTIMIFTTKHIYILLSGSLTKKEIRGEKKTQLNDSRDVSLFKNFSFLYSVEQVLHCQQVGPLLRNHQIFQIFRQPQHLQSRQKVLI